MWRKFNLFTYDDHIIHYHTIYKPNFIACSNALSLWKNYQWPVFIDKFLTVWYSFLWILFCWEGNTWDYYHRTTQSSIETTLFLIADTFIFGTDISNGDREVQHQSQFNLSWLTLGRCISNFNRKGQSREVHWTCNAIAKMAQPEEWPRFHSDLLDLWWLPLHDGHFYLRRWSSIVGPASNEIFPVIESITVLSILWLWINPASQKCLHIRINMKSLSNNKCRIVKHELCFELLLFHMEIGEDCFSVCLWS